MDQATHNKVVSFIWGWGIADDVLRDLFKRGKYPDVILPMCDIRRVDAVLEPTKKRVLETRVMLDNARITQQQAALKDAAGQAFTHPLGCALIATMLNETVSKFNDENNPEAGNHWTPRDAVRLMASLVFLPVKAGIKSNTHTLYD